SGGARRSLRDRRDQDVGARAERPSSSERDRGYIDIEFSIAPPAHDRDGWWRGRMLAFIARPFP
ncbi:MAG: hypothetical protein ACREB9_06845, partial [Thermoplasmata archaeon]